MHSLQEGIDFDGVVISALFFADDLVLIFRTKKRGLERMLRVVGRFCEACRLKNSHYFRAYSKLQVDAEGDEGNILEATLMGKYLGVEIQV